MSGTIPLIHSDVRALDVWTGSSNNFPPLDLVNSPAIDYRTIGFDDSAWSFATVSPSTPTPNALRRFTTDGTRMVPNEDIGSEGIWAGNGHGAVYRWHFNPGPGPFNDAEFFWLQPDVLGGGGIAVVLWLNFDGNTGTAASLAFTPSGNIGSLSGFTSGLIPNRMNLLSAATNAADYISFGFRFPNNAGESTIVSAPGSEKTWAFGIPSGWQTTTFNDSGWSTSVEELILPTAEYTVTSGSGWVTDPFTNGSAGSGLQFVTSATTKSMSLWNGSSNNAPPTDWETPGFDDSAWGGSVVYTPGLNTIWPTAAPLDETEQALFRMHFSLPVGNYGECFLNFYGNDAVDGIWINGVEIPGGSHLGPAGWTVTVPLDPSILVTGGNVLAAIGRNEIQTRVGDATFLAGVSVNFSLEFLARRTWTMPAGVFAATLTLNPDDGIGDGAGALGENLYINGNQLSMPDRVDGNPHGAVTITIPPAFLNPGGTNVLAFDVVSLTNEITLSYKLTSQSLRLGTPSGWTAVIG